MIRLPVFAIIAKCLHKDNIRVSNLKVVVTPSIISIQRLHKKYKRNLYITLLLHPSSVYPRTIYATVTL